MKILVCGNGPSLSEQLKGVDLDQFNKVVRVNRWHDIPEYDNRCDVWCFNPAAEFVFDDHDYGYERNKNRLLWVPYPGMFKRFVNTFGRWPDYHLTSKQVAILKYVNGMKQTPSTGFLAIYMALCLGTHEVYTAGFDFFAPIGNRYYYDDPANELHTGDMGPRSEITKHEKIWYGIALKGGYVKKL